MLVRTIAVGLLLGSFITLKFFMDAFKWFSTITPEFAFMMALRTLSESVAQTAGVNFVFAGAYLAGGLGLGLAAAGVFYPLLERTVIMALFMAAKATLAATQLLRQTCSSRWPNKRNTVISGRS